MATTTPFAAFSKRAKGFLAESKILSALPVSLNLEQLGLQKLQGLSNAWLALLGVAVLPALLLVATVLNVLRQLVSIAVFLGELTS